MKKNHREEDANCLLRWDATPSQARSKEIEGGEETAGLFGQSCKRVVMKSCRLTPYADTSYPHPVVGSERSNCGTSLPNLSYSCPRLKKGSLRSVRGRAARSLDTTIADCSSKKAVSGGNASGNNLRTLLFSSCLPSVPRDAQPQTHPQVPSNAVAEEIFSSACHAGNERPCLNSHLHGNVAPSTSSELETDQGIRQVMHCSTEGKTALKMLVMPTTNPSHYSQGLEPDSAATSPFITRSVASRVTSARNLIKRLQRQETPSSSICAAMSSGPCSFPVISTTSKAAARVLPPTAARNASPLPAGGRQQATTFRCSSPELSANFVSAKNNTVSPAGTGWKHCYTTLGRKLLPLHHSEMLWSPILHPDLSVNPVHDSEGVHLYSEFSDDGIKSPSSLAWVTSTPLLNEEQASPSQSSQQTPSLETLPSLAVSSASSTVLCRKLNFTQEKSVEASGSYVTSVNLVKHSLRSRSLNVCSVKSASTAKSLVNFGTQIEHESKAMTPAKYSLKPVTPARPSLEPVTPAKPSLKPVTPAKPSLKPVTPAKPSLKPVTPAKPSLKPVTPAKPSLKPVTPAKPSLKPVTPAKPSSKPVTPAKPSPRPVTPAKPSLKPVTPAKPSLKPVTPAKPSLKPVTPAKPSLKPQTLAKPSLKLKTLVKPPLKPQTPAKPSLKPMTPGMPSLKPGTPSKPSMKPQTPEKPSLKPQTLAMPSLKPVNLGKSSLKPQTSAKPSLKPVTPGKLSLEPVAPTMPSLKPVISAKSSLKPVTPPSATPSTSVAELCTAKWTHVRPFPSVPHMTQLHPAAFELLPELTGLYQSHQSAWECSNTLPHDPVVGNNVGMAGGKCSIQCMLLAEGDKRVTEIPPKFPVVDEEVKNSVLNAQKDFDKTNYSKSPPPGDRANELHLSLVHNMLPLNRSKGQVEAAVSGGKRVRKTSTKTERQKQDCNSLNRTVCSEPQPDHITGKVSKEVFPSHRCQVSSQPQARRKARAKNSGQCGVSLVSKDPAGSQVSSDLSNTTESKLAMSELGVTFSPPTAVPWPDTKGHWERERSRVQCNSHPATFSSHVNTATLKAKGKTFDDTNVQKIPSPLTQKNKLFSNNTVTCNVVRKLYLDKLNTEITSQNPGQVGKVSTIKCNELCRFTNSGSVLEKDTAILPECGGSCTKPQVKQRNVPDKMECSLIAPLKPRVVLKRLSNNLLKNSTKRICKTSQPTQVKESKTVWKNLEVKKSTVKLKQCDKENKCSQSVSCPTTNLPGLEVNLEEVCNTTGGNTSPCDGRGILTTSQKQDSPCPFVPCYSHNFQVKRRMPETGVVDMLIKKFKLEDKIAEAVMPYKLHIGTNTLAPTALKPRAFQHQPPKDIMTFLPHLSQLLKSVSDPIMMMPPKIESTGCKQLISPDPPLSFSRPVPAKHCPKPESEGEVADICNSTSRASEEKASIVLKDDDNLEDFNLKGMLLHQQGVKLNPRNSCKKRGSKQKRETRELHLIPRKDKQNLRPLATEIDTVHNDMMDPELLNDGIATDSMMQENRMISEIQASNECKKTPEIKIFTHPSSTETKSNPTPTFTHPDSTQNHYHALQTSPKLMHLDPANTHPDLIKADLNSKIANHKPTNVNCNSKKTKSNLIKTNPKPTNVNCNPKKAKSSSIKTNPNSSKTNSNPKSAKLDNSNTRKTDANPNTSKIDTNPNTRKVSINPNTKNCKPTKENTNPKTTKISINPSSRKTYLIPKNHNPMATNSNLPRADSNLKETNIYTTWKKINVNKYKLFPTRHLKSSHSLLRGGWSQSQATK